MAEKLFGSLSYNRVKEKMDYLQDASDHGALGPLGKTITQVRVIVTTMKIERYYSSVKEEVSPLSDSAKTLLDKQDFVGFFKSCGPNYVRGIRRAQELTTMIKFYSPSTKVSSAFAAELKANPDDDSFSKKSKFSGITNSLDIDILGFGLGLGLNHEGSSTLVASTLHDLSETMKFAFKSFTKNSDSFNVGMVYGMEIVPWVDNTAFQVASKVLDENINIPLPFSLIPKAVPVQNVAVVPAQNVIAFVNSDVIRGQFSCKNSAFHIDMNGFCCEGTMLYNNATNEYEYEDKHVAISSHICKPVRKLENSIVKNNMSNNAEFVVRLDLIIQKKMNQIFTLEKCINSVNSIPLKNQYNILKSSTTKYDAAIEARFTVKELKMVLDPLGDYGLIKEMGKELDEFIEMYYQPCIAALFGSNIGFSPDIEPQYFMAYGWLEHDACAKFHCLADNMRWDRDLGGCISSVIIGSDTSLNFGESQCSRNKQNICKYPTSDLNTFINGAKTCWGNGTVPFYLMNYFCMPQIAAIEADDSMQVLIDQSAQQCIIATPSYRRLRGVTNYRHNSIHVVDQNLRIQTHKAYS